MKKIIMIVDDREISREFLIFCLERRFKLLPIPEKIMPDIIEAEDTEQAWRFLTKGIAPDFMIVGFKMPGINGIELIDKIKNELQLKAKIILFSSFPFAESEAEKRNCQFISKEMGWDKKIFDLAVEKGLFTAQYSPAI